MIRRGPLGWPRVPIALASAALFGASTPAAARRRPRSLAARRPALPRCVTPVRPCTQRSFAASEGSAVARATMTGGILGPVLLMLGLARTSTSTAALLLILEGLATMGIRLGALLRARRRSSADRNRRHPCRRLAALLAERSGGIRLGCPRDCRGVRRLGLRQQLDPQVELERPGADRDGQEPHRRRGQCFARLVRWSAAAVVVPGRRRCH